MWVCWICRDCNIEIIPEDWRMPNWLTGNQDYKHPKLGLITKNPPDKKQIPSAGRLVITAISIRPIGPEHVVLHHLKHVSDYITYNNNWHMLDGLITKIFCVRWSDTYVQMVLDVRVRRSETTYLGPIQRNHDRFVCTKSRKFSTAEWNASGLFK